MLFDYTYNKVINSDRLTLEIQQNPSITVALDHIGVVDTTVTIWFRAALSTDEQTALNTIVTNHINSPLEPDAMPISIESESCVTWTQFKSFSSSVGCFINYIDLGTIYFIWTIYNEHKAYVPALTKGTTDATDFETNYKAKCNKQTDISAVGSQLVEQSIYTGPPNSKAVSIVTPDFTDRTSWYQKSVQVVGETLTDSGDGLTFNSVNPWWVNIYGKLTYTYKQIPKRDGTFGAHKDWAVSVSINNVVQTSGYTVDYVNGKVTFSSSQSGATVKATYWHTNGVSGFGEWLLAPPAGKKYIVEHVEVQISVNAVVTSPVRMEVWAGSNLATYGSFPDYLFDAGYGQFRADYRGMRDLINTANLGQGVLKAVSDMQNDVVVLPFDYVQAFTLDSAVGALFRFTVLNNIPATGELLTATFYLQIRNS